MVAHIWRERYVVSCIAGQNLATGVILGLPAILTPAITSNSTESNIHVSKEEASWITAAQSITGPIGYLIIPSLMQIYGRRYINIITNLFVLIGTVTIASATSSTGLIAGRSIQGLVFCQLFISSLLIAEYSHPKRRGSHTVFKFIAINFGMLLCHTLSIVLHWRQIVWLSTVPSILGVICTLTWPESPSWLAYKARYDDCTNSFEWLRGKGLESRTELRELITGQREIRKMETSSSSFAGFVEAFRSKEFLKPFSITVYLAVIKHACGVFYLLSYTIQIITQITGDKSNSLYYAVGLAFIKLLAASSSLIWIKMFRRRTLLFTAGSVSCMVLVSTCVLDYLNKSDSFHNPFLSPIALAVYVVVINLGLIPVSSVIKGEIFPVKFKGVGTSTCGIANSLISALVLKITSNMLQSLDTYGTFFVYSTVMSLFLVVLYFILPETKDRTLQDIENEILDLKINNVGFCDIEMKIINKTENINNKNKVRDMENIAI